ncbi:MAG TPA: WYL domain-containing protein [Opitutaceae bacterium]|nr:WYL domain-containing protein [Opitutaceae bacterium]
MEEAAQFVTGNAGPVGLDRVARIDLPDRRIADHIIRDLVRAVWADSSVAIYYYSIHSGTEGWRTIRPHAFAHDGYRWHTRAWCHEDNAYKDFVLGRIAKIRPAPDGGKAPPPDKEWRTRVTIRFQAHRDLTTVQRAALERDFGMERGVGTLRVRKALLFYTLVYLGLADAGTGPLRRLQLLKTPEA